MNNGDGLTDADDANQYDDLRAGVDLSNPYEVLYWTKVFAVTSAELKTAVEQAGPGLRAVRHFLGIWRAEESKTMRF
jgi:hypothetical protein